MKLKELNEAKRSPKQVAALRSLKDFDKFMFTGFKMIRANGSLSKSLETLFKDDPSVDFEEILEDIDENLKNIKRDISILSDLVKFKKEVTEGSVESLSEQEKRESERVLDELREIVKSKTAKKIKFAKGGNILVDIFTASAVVRALDGVSEKAREAAMKVIDNKGKVGFVLVVDKIFKAVK